MLNDLSLAAGELAAETGRHIHLVLENDDNRVSLLDPLQDPPCGKYHAQWNDDYHHAWHVKLTGEKQGYYRDYQRAPLSDIARCLGSGFVYQGEASEHRGGQLRGEASGALPPTAFVNFLQNHDQIGNRAFGDRLENHVKPEAIEAGLAITLLAPAIPMLFMGEEWGSKVPFPFFCDFKGDLAEAVRKGRREEYAWAYEKFGSDVPDPLSEATFRSAILDWDARGGSGHDRLALVRELLATRRRHIMPRLAGARFGEARMVHDGTLKANWHLGDDARLLLTANLSDRTIAVQSGDTGGSPIWGKPGDAMKPWSVCWCLEAG